MKNKFTLVEELIEGIALDTSLPLVHEADVNGDNKISLSPIIKLDILNATKKN